MTLFNNNKNKAICFLLVVAVLFSNTFFIELVDGKEQVDRKEGKVWFNPFPFNLVLTNQCAEEFFIKFNFFHWECLKKSLVKAVGYAIVVLSSILKLPIIVNIIKNQSAIGLSASSLLIEITALSASFSQSIIKQHPFSACLFCHFFCL